MEPATIALIMQAVGAAGALKGLFTPEPDKPDMGEYQGLSGAELQSALGSIKSRIAGQTEGSVRKLRTSLASRGLLRSGMTGSGEGEIRGAGDTATSEAINQFLMAEQNKENQWNLARFSADQDAYKADMSRYYDTMVGSGKTLADIGMSFAKPKDDSFEKLLALITGGGKSPMGQGSSGLNEAIFNGQLRHNDVNPFGRA